MLYCVSEYSNQLFTVRCDKNGMELLQAQSTLAPDFSGESFGSAICRTGDGQFLYTANRGEDTIACFILDKNGMATPVGRYPCGGHWPRHIALLDGDTLLAAANERSGEVVFWKRDQVTGGLMVELLRIPHKRASYIGQAT